MGVKRSRSLGASLAVVTAVVGVGILAQPASAGSCQTTLVDRASGSSASCTAYSTGFLVVGVSGVTRIQVTCNGNTVYDITIGTNFREISPGPCTMTLTLTAQAAGTTAIGTTA